MSEFVAALFLIAYYGVPLLFLIAWIWTIVLAFSAKHIGLGILFILIGPLAFLYALRYPIRCKVPLAMFVVGIAALAALFVFYESFAPTANSAT